MGNLFSSEELEPETLSQVLSTDNYIEGGGESSQSPELSETEIMVNKLIHNAVSNQTIKQSGGGDISYCGMNNMTYSNNIVDLADYV